MAQCHSWHLCQTPRGTTQMPLQERTVCPASGMRWTDSLQLFTPLSLPLSSSCDTSLKDGPKQRLHSCTRPWTFPPNKRPLCDQSLCQSFLLVWEETSQSHAAIWGSSFSGLLSSPLISLVTDLHHGLQALTDNVCFLSTFSFTDINHGKLLGLITSFWHLPGGPNNHVPSQQEHDGKWMRVNAI